MKSPQHMENIDYDSAQDRAGQPRLLSLKSGAWQGWLLVGLVIWLLVGQAYHGAINPNSIITGADFRVFYDAANRLNHGEPLYHQIASSNNAERFAPYIYSPLLAMVLRPLARLPFETALQAWYLVSAGAVVLAALLWNRAGGRGAFRPVWICLMLVLAFRFFPMISSFALGQSNTLLLLCVAGVAWADARKKSALIGVLIAVAALFKVWMLGALLFPMLRRDGKALAWAVGTYALALPALFLPLGWTEWQNFWRATAANAEQVELISQCIAGFARVYFAENPHLRPLVESRAAFWGFIGVGYAVVGAGFLWLWSKGKPASSYESRLWLGLVALSLPIVSPLCHHEYYVLALPLLWTLLASPREDLARGNWPIVVAALALFFLLSRSWPVSGDGFQSIKAGPSALLASAYFLLGSLLWLLGLAAIWRARGVANEGQELTATAEPLPATLVETR